MIFNTGGEQSPFNVLIMNYIVIETHGGPLCAIIVTDRDGNNLVFDTFLEVEQEASDCQVGIIVEV